MSAVRLIVPEVQRLNTAIRMLRPLTGRSMTDLKTAIESGQPVHTAELFMNDHEEVAATLREIVRQLDGSGLDYQVFEDEFQIDPSVLLNVLESHDGVQRQFAGDRLRDS